MLEKYIIYYYYDIFGYINNKLNIRVQNYIKNNDKNDKIFICIVMSTTTL